MSLMSRLFSRRSTDADEMRPLWHAVVAEARAKDWYAQAGVADTVPGRFDAVTLVLALVLLRIERSPSLAETGVRLTELFVDDMDGQLRQSGVGDLVVGKHMGKLMGTLGGRLGTLRAALAADDDAALAEFVTRNVTLLDGAGPHEAAGRVRVLAAHLDRLSDESLLAGEIGQ